MLVGASIRPFKGSTFKLRDPKDSASPNKAFMQSCHSPKLARQSLMEILAPANACWRLNKSLQGQNLHAAAARIVSSTWPTRRYVERTALSFFFLFSSLTPNSRALPLKLDQRFFFRAAEKKKLDFFFQGPKGAYRNFWDSLFFLSGAPRTLSPTKIPPKYRFLIGKSNISSRKSCRIS